MHRIGRTGRAGRSGTAMTLVKPREHRLLRTIENLTKQKIEVCSLPTVADLRAKRLELTRASLLERIIEGDFEDVRVVVQSLAESAPKPRPPRIVVASIEKITPPQASRAGLAQIDHPLREYFRSSAHRTGARQAR